MKRLVTSAVCCALTLLCCTSWALQWNFETIDSSTNISGQSDIALDSSGRPYVVYSQSAFKGIGFAYKSGTTWNRQTIGGTPGSTSYYPSIALDSSGKAYVSYTVTGPCDLSFASQAGSSWNIETVDSDGNTGQRNSMAIDSSGQVHISYFTFEGNQLRYAVGSSGSWSTSLVSTLDTDSSDTALALDNAGSPSICYRKNGLSYAHWNGSTWANQIVDPGANAGYMSMVFDKNGNPHISYIDWFSSPTGNLKYASWNGSNWVVTIANPTGPASGAASLALDAQGNPYIAYCTANNYDLRLTHWDGSSWVNELVDAECYGQPSIAIDGANKLSIVYAGGPLKFATTTVPEPNCLMLLLPCAGVIGVAVRKRS